MPMDRFLIAPLDKGLQNDLRPWLIPDEAYATLSNAYMFRSRVRKRFGSEFVFSSVMPAIGYEQTQSRLRINVTTVMAGNATGTVPGAVFAIGQMFSIGNNFYTVIATGAPANLLRSDGVVAVATYDTTNGNFVINAPPVANGTIVYFYPATPVMGLLTYESVSTPNQVEPTIAFDTQFAYQYGSTGWERLSSGTSVWTGNDSQFFWSTTYKGNASSDRIFYVTNYNQADGIRYWDGSTWTTMTITIDAAGDTVLTARMVVTFKDRLVLLNTIENIAASPTSFVNRCRFSQNGSPLASDAWRQDIPGKGSFIDCPTSEAAISAEFIKDRLIVFFQRSTWELAYTGNQVLPFVWQKINTEFGAESTFSVVPYDKVAFSIDSIGILACNGANVERIDRIIPDEVLQFSNDNNGPLRVYGIRDYQLEMVYWTYPHLAPDGTSTESPYPNRVLTYNYRDNAWATNDDSITCFGYFQSTQGLTWAQAEQLWGQADFVWNAGEYQPLERNIIAGNQEGFTFVIRPDTPRNAPALQITNISISGDQATITAINNNLEAGSDYVLIESAIGVVGFNGNIFQIYSVASNFSSFVIIAQTAGGFSGAYLGGGVVTRVSQIDIQTKQYNFYTSQGKNCAINKVDFMVDRTATGAVTVDVFTSSSDDFSLVEEGAASGALLGTNVLETTPYAIYPYEQQQIRLWHTVYFQADGECIQFKIYLSPAQMVNSSTALQDFQMHAFCVYAQASASRFQ